MERFDEQEGRSVGRNNRISDERLFEMLNDYLILEAIIEYLSPSIDVDMEEFEANFADYLSYDRWSFIDMEVSFFATQETEEAEEFMAALQAGGDFRELAFKFVQGINLLDAEEDEEEIASIYEELWDVFFEEFFITVPLNDFIQMFRPSPDNLDDIRAISRMQTGDHSAIMFSEEVWVYAIVYVESVEEPDYKELRELFLEETIASEVSILFSNFVDTLEFDLNQPGMNSVRMGRLY